MDVEKLRALLRQRLEEVDRLEHLAHEAARPVELDQTSVGRLSRMDAMQAQAMAQETERRRHAEHARIVAALERIEAGEYGYCVTCDEPIAEKRLEFDPAATQCVKCAGGAEHR